MRDKTITVNTVHLATKLAHEATVNHFMDSNIYEDEGDLFYEEDGILIYQEEVQPIFNKWYDYYFNLLNLFS
jgi:hypothetical protein